jgi:hypothetical protein
MKVLICGDRNYKNKGRIREILENGFDRFPDEIIEGGCSGADSLARELGEEYKIHVKEFPADWAAYGNYAGLKRNKEMLDQNPDRFIALPE